MPPKRLTYRQIAADLEARIRHGQYPPGTQLPSYKEVAVMYSVGLTTAQTVMRMLADWGLSESVPGVGTFVVDPLPDRR